MLLSALCVMCRGVVASSSSSNVGPSSAGSDDNSAGEDASTPSTSYSLPWETEQPAPPPNYASIQANIGHMDSNQLQTALGVAIAAEDYQLAARYVDCSRFVQRWPDVHAVCLSDTAQHALSSVHRN
jgi:hypothetical protein